MAVVKLKFKEMQNITRLILHFFYNDTFDELAALLNGAMDLLVADFMRIDFTIPEKNIIWWQMQEGNCFAFKGISRLEAIDAYECGVLLRIDFTKTSRWL